MHVGKGRQHGAHINRLGFGPGQFRVQAGGIRNVADQAIEPAHVILDDGHEFPLLFRVLKARRCFNGAAERGQRILDLMRHVGGEILDFIHAPPQRLCHLGQALRQVADFVIAPGEIGNDLVAAVVPAHLFGRFSEAADRPDDGARQINGQQKGDRQHTGENLQDIEPHFQKRVVDGM